MQVAPQPIAVQEVQVSRQDIIHAIKTDLNTLAATAMPEDYKFGYPPYYHALLQTLIEAVSKVRDFSQYALGLPRGFAKTTFLKLLVFWLIAFSDKRFILIVLSTNSMAENFLADMSDLLDEENIVTIFGDWRKTLTKDTAMTKEFTFAGRSIKLAAVGAGVSLRGIVRKNKRPDVQIMDDIQLREEADSPVLSTKLLNWMLGTLMYTRSNFGCQHIFVGNMYPTEHCILRKLQLSPDWLSFITGAILADGTSLWEDLHPVESLYEELAKLSRIGRADIFMAEKMNDPSTAASTNFDLTLVKQFDPAVTGDMHQGNYLIIDPSGSKRKTDGAAKDSDDTAFGYYELYDGVPHLRYVKAEIMTPKQTIKNALLLCGERNCRLIAVEAVAYQATLLFWFEEAMKELGIEGITLVPLQTKGLSKNSRIGVGIKQLQAGEISLNPDVVSLVTNQIYQFDPRKLTNKDDILDLVAYGPQVMVDYGDFVKLPDDDLYSTEDLTVADENESSAI